MTIWYDVLTVLVGIFIVGATAVTAEFDGHSIIVSVLVAMVIMAIMIACGFWYFNYTASGIRALKDQESNLSNGLPREITITAEDGRQIFHYSGKCDIETGNDGYILFEDEQGLRQIIYYGKLDTVMIKELPTK